MPRRPEFILSISIRNIEDFSPEAIVKSPRTFRPQDVQNACRNILLQPQKDTPEVALAVAHFVAIDFLAFAHSTGLFNRQIKLWENLSRTQKVEVHQMSKGLFSKEKLSQFDFAFLDHKGRTTALARYAAPEQGESFDYLRDCREFLQRAAKYTGLSGIFLCYPNPFPQNVLDFIKKETNSSNPLAKYESIYPKLAIPVDLLELSRGTVFSPADQVQKHQVRVIHPDLTKKKLGGNVIAGSNLDANLDSNSDSQSIDTFLHGGTAASATSAADEGVITDNETNQAE